MWNVKAGQRKLCLSALSTVNLLNPRVSLKKDKKISASADQASLPSSRDSNVSQASAASAGISEARVAELISMQLGEFSSSFAATMQASFDNIKTFIDDRFAQETQLEPNPSISDSSLYRSTWALARPRQTPPCVTPV